MKGRTRTMKYSDYGITEGAERELIGKCQSADFDNRMTLLACAEQANEMIASELYYSIVKGISYEKLSTMKYIPLSKPDFYGYRRKCLAIFNNAIADKPTLEQQKKVPRRKKQDDDGIDGQIRCDIVDGKLIYY